MAPTATATKAPIKAYSMSPVFSDYCSLRIVNELAAKVNVMLFPIRV
jgi:hypothetical protein